MKPWTALPRPDGREEINVIVEYHRPQTLEEALQLLSRPSPRTVPLGGGTVVSRPGQEDLAVVDLQALGLNQIQSRGDVLEIGASTTLQDLLDRGAQHGAAFWPDLQKTLELEEAYNLRHTVTLAGKLVSSTGRSGLTAALLALDAQLALLPDDQKISLGDLLPLRQEKLPGRLITAVSLPLKARLAYEYIARTPADWPVVCAAVARWPSGRTRVALAGYGTAPFLAMDGPEAAGAETAAREAFSNAGDAWADAAYRAEMAELLTRRALQSLES
jgi:CO/xanthine dehydrogenase FAD-binding subunit